MIPYLDVGIGLAIVIFGLGIVYLNGVKLRTAVRIARSHNTLDTTTISDGATRTATGDVQPHPDNELVTSPTRLNSPDSVFCEWAVDEGRHWGRVQEGEIGTTALLDIGDRRVAVDFSDVSQANLTHDDNSPLFFENEAPKSELETFLKENSEYAPDIPDAEPLSRRVLSKSIQPGDSVTVTGVVSRSHSADSPFGIELSSGSESELDRGLSINNWSTARSIAMTSGRLLIVIFGVVTVIAGALIGTGSYYPIPVTQYTAELLLGVGILTYTYISLESIIYRLMGTQAGG